MSVQFTLIFFMMHDLGIIFHDAQVYNLLSHFILAYFQHQIYELNRRLGLCNGLNSSNSIDISYGESDSASTKSLKITALAVSLMLLALPFFFLKYVEYVSKKQKSLDSTAEEVPLNKQLEYKVDVFLSVYPYAKPLALLVATLLLIFVGGLALFGVTDESLTDCLWLSWTFVAAPGNHADSEGLGPRLVSATISCGGMLIFAMMLGLVSDSISEKLDSLRKGKSEVVKQNHTLILGWSDKLVSAPSNP